MSRKQLLTAAACLLVLVTCGANVYAQSAGAGQPERGETARRALAEIITAGGGNFLGVHTEDVTRENAGRFQLSGEPRGVGVAEVTEGGPAAKAGVQKGDVIVRFDGEPVTSAAKLRRLIAEAAPEHTARLTILRGGAEREVQAKLGRRAQLGSLEGLRALEGFRLPEGQVFRFDGDEWKKQAEQWKKFGEQWEKQGDEWRLRGEEWRKQLENMPQLRGQLEDNGNFVLAFGGGRRIGVSTTQLGEQLADYFGVSERRGLLVTSVAADGPAAKAGIKAGDVITEADGEKVDDSADLLRVIGRKDEGDVTLTVVRDRSRRSVRVTPEKRATPGQFFIPARPRAGAFVLPRVEARVRPHVLPSLRRFAAPRVVRPAVPRVVAPSRARTMIL